MKVKLILVSVIALLHGINNKSFSQSNAFPANGNVGIGTLTPPEKLSVITPAGASTGVSQSNGTIKVGMSIGTTGGYYGTLTNHPLFFRTNNGAAQVTLLQNGRVGIGTIAPAGKLDVTGEDSYFQGIRTGTGRGFDTTNTCFGRNALVNNIANMVNNSGVFNTTVGSNTLRANTTGQNNTAIGYGVLRKNTDGDGNTAIGANALQGNTASENTAVGYNTLDSNRSGAQNTALGTHALYNNTTGNWNTGLGRYAIYNNKSGYDNTAVGDVALYYVTTGSNNTGMGYFATPNTGGLTNTTALGYNSRTTASNQVRLGNSAVTSIGGYANWTNVSDGRIKKNIKANVPGLNFINQLQPVTYNLSIADADRITNTNPIPDKEKNEVYREQGEQARKEKEQVVYTGFIAQDVEKAARSLSFDFSGIDAPKNEQDLYGLRYAEFVVPLVKAVQELSKMNSEKDARIDNLQKQIDELREMMAGDRKLSAARIKGALNLSSAKLNQNSPNPFTNSTKINYTLPATYTAAKIIVADNSGKIIKEIKLSGKDNGSVEIDTTALNGGVYQYTLYIDGMLAGSRQMILSR